MKEQKDRLMYEEPFAWTSVKAGEQIDESVIPSKGAVIICDMWDRHWCRGASKRVEELAKPIARFVDYMRRYGFLIVHCPSNTMGWYAEHPARKRILSVGEAPASPPLETWCPLDETVEPPLPFDDSDGGCFCQEKCSYCRPYVQENEQIFIDPERDVIGDGFEVYSYLRKTGIEKIFYCGVHANICIPGRPFGIRQMTRQGFSCVLVRDLIDVMYNPAMPPYIDHFEAIDLMAQHMDTHWCTSALSGDIMHDSSFRFVEDYRVF